MKINVEQWLIERIKDSAWEDSTEKFIQHAILEHLAWIKLREQAMRGAE